MPPSCWLGTAQVSPDTYPLKLGVHYPLSAYFTPSPSVGCHGLKQLTAGRRAPCSSRRLFLLTPCCPVCQSARPPPRGKQRLCKPMLTSEEGWEIQVLPQVRMVGNSFLIFSLYQINPREGRISSTAPKKPPCLPRLDRPPTPVV